MGDEVRERMFSQLVGNAAVSDRAEMAARLRTVFKRGCLLGDLAREDVSLMSDDEECMMACALEGYIAGAGELPPPELPQALDPRAEKERAELESKARRGRK